MTPSTLALLACTLCAVEPPAADERDTVVLKTGKEIRCRVVLELDDRVAIVVRTREQWIDRKKIRSISSIQRSLAAILTKFDGGSDKIDELIALAKECERARLPHEARLFYWSVLVVDPAHAIANASLGHKQSGKSWRVPVAGSWRTLDQAEKIHADWGKARKMRSEHFELRTDAGMRVAVQTLFELEAFYRHLFDLFQTDLELREVTTPIQVYVYRDADSFPRLSNTVDAYFSRVDNVLFTFLDDKKRPLTLFHQATHATIFNLGGGGRGRRNDLPGWLNEGWADYMEGILQPGKNGRLKLDLARRVGYRIGNLNGEKKPYSLRRVLNLRETDFYASTRQKLKYAQAYALTLLMMEGENGKYTERFLKYMKQSLAGKGSSSAFRSVFRKDLKAIEKNHLLMK